MDELTRLHYLEAMGIAVWTPRDQPEPIPVGYAMRTLPLAEEKPAEEVPSQFSIHHAPHQPPPNAEQWQHLQQQVRACQACDLAKTRTQIVFGVGNQQADWLLIGEAPGQNEDLMGEPFVGKAGQLLNEMLKAIGLSREQVYIANILKCRPPNNRDPQSHEIAACRGFLQQQIALIQPRLIVAVGRIAAQTLLNQTVPLSKLRGIQHQLDNIPLVVVHHPAYLLRSPLEKRKAWEDLQFALKIFNVLKE